jgi:hypothetical protein
VAVTRAEPDRPTRNPRPNPKATAVERRADLSREYGPNLVAALLLVVGLGLWASSLHSIPTTNLTDYGLPPVFPATWYAGLELLLVGFAVVTCAPRSSPALQGALVIAVVVVLFATVPAISGPPHYAWTYKHIGVVRHITTTGKLDPNLDIYNRWPGFFAAAGLLSSLFGIEDPSRYAAWAEVFFSVIDVFLVVAIARTLTRDARLSWAAGMIFTVANWIGQDYFSPQAFDFVLIFGIYLIILRFMPLRQDLRHLPVIGAILRRLRWKPNRLRIVNDGPGPSSRAAGATIVLLDLAAVISHQLSPYMLLLGLAALMVFRVLRSWWLFVAVVIITIGFLAPNISYINEHFGLFSSGLGSAGGPVLQEPNPMAGKTFHSKAGLLLSVVIWILMIVGLVRRLRRRHATVIPVVLLAIAPMVTIAGQSYGGEGILRVYLFSLPWASILAVWAIAPTDGWWKPRQAPLLLGLLTLLAGLFVPAFFGQEEQNIMPTDELAGAHYFYSHVERPATVLFAGTNVPFRSAPNYGDYDDSTDITVDPPLCRTSNPSKLLTQLETQFDNRVQPNFIVFTTTGTAATALLGYCTPRQIATMEQTVARSGLYETWYVAPNIRIYLRNGAILGDAPDTRTQK